MGLLNAIKPLYIIAIFQALLIAIYLVVRKKGNRTSRIILALLLIDFIIFLTGTLVLLLREFRLYRMFAHLANLTVFLAPPLLYIYYLSLTNHRLKINYKMLWHTLPFIGIFVLMFYNIVLQTDHRFVFRPYGIFLLMVLFLQNLFYLLLIFKQRGLSSFQRSDDIKAKWFGFLFMAIILIFSLKLLIFIIWNIIGWADVCIFFTGLFFIFSFIIINMLVIYGLYYPDVLVNYIKYQSSSLDDKSKSNIYNNLLQILNEKQLFLDPLLNLNKLAKNLNISGKLLSQLINENTGNNFNDFINQYRIKEAQHIMTQDKGDQKNILDIAYEVGFNSKSTFNTAFKKFTEMTPSEFKKKLGQL